MCDCRLVTPDERNDAALIWDYHQLHHRLQACSAAICLGGPDPALAEFAAHLYADDLFTVLVFTGATSTDTEEWFPDGEAVHNRACAIELGVPPGTILVEPYATNTGENIIYSKKALDAAAVTVDRVMLICMPYMERRAYATCKKVWPKVEVICASERYEFGEYAKRIGNTVLALGLILGDLQRVIEYPKKGFAIEQHVPEHIQAAYHRLLAAGYTSRLAEI